ncbi:GntR family transcriptional regulator [Falsirhodobacter algicola]|uniref:FCD domain-containing protein n=1 Tax=Falsirhodobacter algicola TaxID=2692330 RepID=A0A8J8MU22_9RHOB|nr:GntR family transcriptional regulator [Falsirhodobacter algicola]QUS36750.1 FCD domain-containing protein [Falsirhodobacter algicola]
MADTTAAEPTARKRGAGPQYVYDTLRDEILDLVLQPGSPIEETQISERLKVSRTPIREALVRLAGEGLVATLPNRSTIVSHIDFLQMQSFFDAITLMYRVTTRRAGELHQPADLEIIRARQDDFAAAVAEQNARRMIATNRDFHSAIADAGRNPYYSGMFARLLDDGRRLLRLYYLSYQDQLPVQYVTEHEDIIAAIAARDVEECDRLATAHAAQIVAQVQKLLTGEKRSDIPL